MSLTIGIARKLSSGDRLGRLGLEVQCISVLATLASEGHRASRGIEWPCSPCNGSQWALRLRFGSGHGPSRGIVERS